MPQASAFACPVCTAASAGWVSSHAQHRIARCLTCGHGYVWPLPDAAYLASIYQNQYYTGAEGSLGFRDYAALEPARRRMFNRHLDRIERMVRPGRLLDVGCGTGDFLKQARARGWTVAGVDPSAARTRVQEAGIPLVGSTLADAQVKDGTMDVITFWDVLEHLTNPVADLRRARGLLRPGGILAATVPDAGNLLARLSGRRWFGYKTAGEHLQFFTAGSLRLAFERAGFALATGQAVTWSCTLEFLADRLGLYMGVPGKIAARVLTAGPLRRVVVDVPQVNQFAVGV